MFRYLDVIDVTAVTPIDCDGTASATGSATRPSIPATRERHVPITIADVAARAGVSKTTVSRVLNGKGELDDGHRGPGPGR